jgi:hypothetical protein
MATEGQPWTDRRVQQLMSLRALLREAKALNSASGVSRRIERVVELSASLDSLDFDAEDPASFKQFLETLCINARSTKA